MIVVAILGLLAAIAIPTFTRFALKSKKVEAQLVLDKMMRDMRVYHHAKSALPPSTNILPAVPACQTGTDKTVSTAPSVWYSDPGWAALEFHVVDVGYFQYSWTKTSDTEGVAQAIGDTGCDGIPELLVIEVSTGTGNVFETVVTDIN